MTQMDISFLKVAALAAAIAAATVPSLAQQPAAGQDNAAQKAEAPSPQSGEGAKEGHFEIARQNWTFSGPLGYFDEQQLRRGYKVYKTICANCHSLRQLSYRNLGERGGPQFPKEVVEEIAKEAQVADETAPDGMRPGKPSDHFVWAFKSKKEAAAALGAVPPDLSVMAKARGIEREVPFYLFPYVLAKDIVTQYQEQGSDYIYALLTSYKEPPASKQMASGMNYNLAFPGHQTAMPQPLQDGSVDYEDGTPNTLDQEARDVTAFLTWTAEPHLVARKKLGLIVLGYLIVACILLFLAKKTLWRNIKH